MTRIDDGHGIQYEFSANPDVNLWEKEVTPPGMDGGEPNNTTTMRNRAWETLAPQKLKTLTESGATVAYAVASYSEFFDMINVNQEITITYPDGGTVQFWGYLQRFVPNAVVRGQQPTANIRVIPTNQDNDGNEVEPVITPAV